MTTKKTFAISLTDSASEETANADYFQIEDRWITFKTEGGKTVVAYPEDRVTRIKCDPDLESKVHGSVHFGLRMM